MHSLATVVAVSRVTESTHWSSDCFVGAIIGYYETRLVEKLNYSSGNNYFTASRRAPIRFNQREVLKGEYEVIYFSRNSFYKFILRNFL